MGRLVSKQRGSKQGDRLQGGSIAVESALILPVLLAAVAATIIVGLRLSDQMYLNQAARELGIVLSRVPYMAALRDSRRDSYTIKKSDSYTSPETFLANLNDGANTCGPASSIYYNCTSAAQSVIKWYAQQIFFIKRMFIVNDTVRLNVSYSPPAADSSPPSGLCMIKVTITATATGWLSWAASSIVVSQSIPYVSAPVPPDTYGCCPAGAGSC